MTLNPPQTQCSIAVGWEEALCVHSPCRGLQLQDGTATASGCSHHCSPSTTNCWGSTCWNREQRGLDSNTDGQTWGNTALRPIWDWGVLPVMVKKKEVAACWAHNQAVVSSVPTAAPRHCIL